MRVAAKTFWAPKAGNDLHQYEDAFWPYWSSRTVTADHHRFAVADGATESAFSRLWARMLVILYCGSRYGVTGSPAFHQPDSHPEIFLAHARRWARIVFANPLPWFAVEKAQHGAFSSLLGLTLFNDPVKEADEGPWLSFSVGDSCLFQLREGELIIKWPLASSGEFGSHPFLIATDPARNAGLWPQLRQHTAEGTWRVGDTFYLMTDALAAWFLGCVEAGEPPGSLVPSPEQPDADYVDWLAALRSAKQIRNDDVTLFRITPLA